MADLRGLGRMLMIVPHQDDEVLLGAGIITQAARMRLPIHVCIVTNGDCGCADQSTGRLRLRETLNSMEYLGLEQEHVTFLGYADTGMPEADSFLSKLSKAGPDEITPSHCGSATYALPEKPSWHRQRFGREAAYCRKSLETDIVSLLEAFAPDTIFTTCPKDTHGDHSALYQFVYNAAQALPHAPTLYQGVVHSLGGDDSWPLRNGVTPLSLPMDMERYTPVRFPLPDGMWDDAFEEHRKQHALRCHVTAMKPDAVDFLTAFVKADELFFLSKEDSHA